MSAGLRDDSRSWLGPAVILLAAAAATAPVLLHGGFCGDDFEFHAVGWFDVRAHWAAGLAYPHWMASANYGAGEPRFMFYPPLTWMFGAALSLVLPWALVPVAMIFLCLAATGWAVRRLALERLDDAPATLAGCVALCSGFALFTAYERTAFAELTGGFWIPMLLLFALRDDAAGAGKRQLMNGATAPMALLLAGAWLSNGPVGVMASYLLAVVAAGSWLWLRDWRPLARACVAAALGIGMAAFALIPAAWEQRWADLRAAVDYPVFAIENNWLFARHTDALLARFAMVLQRASMIEACMIALAAGAAAVVLWRWRLSLRRNGLSAMRERLSPLRWWMALALIPAVVLLMQFPVSLPVWNVLPKLRFLQYPWRWTLVVEAPMGVLLAAAVWPDEARPGQAWRKWAVGVTCALLLAASVAVAARRFLRVCAEGDTMADLRELYEAGGVEGTDEYEPQGADHWLVAKGLPDACLTPDADTVLGVSASDAETPQWQPQQGSCVAVFTAGKRGPEDLHVNAVMPREGFLILRLMRYPAWRVLINGQPVNAVYKGDDGRDDGLIAVPVQRGPLQLDVEWRATSDVIAGRCLSGLALACLVLVAAAERRTMIGKPVAL